MKKAHFAPVVRKVEFAYNEQVVASGTQSLCSFYWYNNQGANNPPCYAGSYVTPVGPGGPIPVDPT